jgi:enoyl-CoA hydratase
LVRKDGAVGLIGLNRPDVLNALSPALLRELCQALVEFEADAEVRAVVIHGNEKAFAAGGDIKQMADATAVEMLEKSYVETRDRLRRYTKPLIAAVSGWCLGGGNELAMACDIVVAAEGAKFGQPEINIGIIPGAGGTQRLTRLVGKHRAMEMILTGRRISAGEAYQFGMVNRVAPAGAYLDEAVGLAREIAAKPPVAVRLAREAINKAHDLTLENGLDFERRLLYMLFSTEDQKEGMRAFLEKRPPQFKGR